MLEILFCQQSLQLQASHWLSNVGFEIQNYTRTFCPRQDPPSLWSIEPSHLIGEGETPWHNQNWGITWNKNTLFYNLRKCEPFVKQNIHLGGKTRSNLSSHSRNIKLPKRTANLKHLSGYCNLPQTLTFQPIKAHYATFMHTGVPRHLFVAQTTISLPWPYRWERQSGLVPAPVSAGSFRESPRT